MNAVILSIGDELVLGQTVDTNSAWISQQLAAVGFAVAAHMTVPDDQPAIERAIVESSGRCDVLILSGGIGPTEDDLTRQALAAVMKAPLDLDPAWLSKLQDFWARRNQTMPAINAIQARIPAGAKLLDNPVGTAAGIRATLAGGRPSTCEVFVLPGVPREMKAMFTLHVLPCVRDVGGGAVILSRTLHTFGMGESSIAEKLGDLMRRNRNPSVGTTVANGIVSLRVNARFEAVEAAAGQLESTSALCHEKLGALIFGQDAQTLPQSVVQLFKDAPGSPTVATAESCTGGLLAKMLTDVAGSSAFFQRGWITYANQAKTELLGVPEKMLLEHGAVSEPVAIAMAIGARKAARSTHALAITGIAGPDGGTPSKPVGTVWLAHAHPQGTFARSFLFPGDREWIRDRSAKMALTILRFHLLAQPLPF